MKTVNAPSMPSRYQHRVLQDFGRLGVIFCALALSACSPFGIANSFNKDADSTVQSDISYGAHPRQKLDWYLPKNPLQPSVAIIFFYGGGWTSGSRGNYEFVARKLASRGYHVAVPDYRLYPEITFPEFVKDGALATAYVVNHLVPSPEDKPPVFLLGHSAGAHIAMLLALDSGYLAEQNLYPERLSGLVGLAGPYDFLPLDPGQLEDIFPEETRQQSQPINFARKDAPPILLIHGDSDSQVWLRNSRNLTAAISNLGGKIGLQVLPGVGHAGMVTPFIGIRSDSSELLNSIDSFISNHHNSTP